MNADKPIREIMTTKMVTVNPEANVRNIKDIFEKNDFHHLPVVDRGEELVGIISKEDFFKVAYILSLGSNHQPMDGPYASLKAMDFMTKYPLVLDPEDTLGLAADIFLANKFHALPIVEDGRLIGIVTTHDLLKSAFNSRFINKENEEIEEEMNG